MAERDDGILAPFDIKSKAEQYVKELRKKEDTNYDEADNKYDAIRHIGASLAMYAQYPDLASDIILGGKEHIFGLGDPRGQKMDLHNNAIGKAIYEGLSEEEANSLTTEKALEMAKDYFEQVQAAEKEGKIDEIPEEMRPIVVYGKTKEPEKEDGGLYEIGPEGTWVEKSKMNKGGLMSARDLLDQIDVEKIPLTIDTMFSGENVKVKNNPVAEKMDADLETAFINFYGSLNNDKLDNATLREAYADAVRSVRARDPEIFDEYFLGPNTDEKIQALNFEAFSDKPLPSTQEESDAGVMSFNIPFGSEGDPNLGGANVNQLLKGVYLPEGVYGDTEIFVPGFGLDREQARSGVLRHEGRHSFFDRAKDPSRIGNEESVVRQLDVLDAVISQDKEKLESIFDIEYGQKLRKNPDKAEVYKDMFDRDVKQRLVHAVRNLPFLYSQGVFDADKANKELIEKFLQDYDKDNQGVISSLLGTDPEKQKEVREIFDVTNLDSEQLAKALSTAPFAEADTPVGMYSVPYDVDREAAEMNEGGLMADPLVLSETAEEEAEPKMGVGEYIQAGMDLVEDFSPAGTAQAMIDAAEEAYKLASGAEDASVMDFGIAAIGALPGGKTAGKVIDNATKVADEIAEASLEISKLDNYVPKKTVKAYKLFTKGEDDNLYPLFVDANKPLPVGEWIKANMPDYIFQAKNGRYYVPSKATAPKTETGKKAFYDTGERKATGSSIEIPDDPELRKKLVDGGFIAKEDTKSVKAVAARPGWHSGDVPIAHHIGAMIDPATGSTKKLEMPNVRRDDQVWAEVELPADVNWQQEALRRANVKKNGEIDVGTAHITDRVPHGGSYRYKTNPNMTGQWLISGELKINRVLDDAEVKAINEAAGVQDLPRYSEFMDQYVKAPTETGIMSAEGAAKKSPAVDMAINVRVDKKADLDYAEKLISGEKVYETRNSRSLDPYIGQRVGIAKTGDGKAQAIGSVEIGEPIEVDEKTFRELQDKHLVPAGSAFDVPEGGKKYLYPVSNPERFESPKDVGRGIVSRKIINKYAGGLMLDEYNRAES